MKNKENIEIMMKEKMKEKEEKKKNNKKKQRNINKLNYNLKEREQI